MHTHERTVEFIICIYLDRDHLALLESFPQPGLRVGEPDMLFESADQVIPVLLASDESAAVYQAGIEEFEERCETALVAVVRRGTKEKEAIRTPGQYFSELAALAALRTVYQRGEKTGRVFQSEKTGKPLANSRHWFEDALETVRGSGYRLNNTWRKAQ